MTRIDQSARCQRPLPRAFGVALLLLVWRIASAQCQPEEAPAEAAPNRAQPIPIETLARPTPVDFESEVLPVLRRNCLACHGQAKPKGGLVLETPKTIARGGDSGPVVEPGHGMESYLLKVAAHQIEDTLMPPKDNKVNASNLTPQELGLLKLWIDQGAQGEVRTARAVAWQPMPPALNAIHAVAISDDGQFVACNRANQVFVYHLPSKQLVTRLRDPALDSSQLYGKDGAAHLDYVQSLAFSPDSQHLASGGYRVAKIWRYEKHPGVPAVELAENQKARLWIVSPDHQWMAALREDGAATLWNPRDQAALGDIRIDQVHLAALAFGPDGQRLAGGTAEGDLIIWSVPDLKVEARVKAPSGIRALAWQSDGRGLYSGGPNKLIHRWSVPESFPGDLAEAGSWAGHEATVTALVALPAPVNQIISASEDGDIRWWNAEDGQMVRQANHGGPVSVLAVRPDGRRVVSAGSDRSAKLWQVAEGKLLAELKGDRHRDEFAAKRERAKNLATTLVAVGKSDVEAAEKEWNQQKERLKKAEETFATADKTFAEKKQELEEATTAKTGAEQALASLKADIERVTEAHRKADESAQESQRLAKSAVERSASSKAAAQAAAQALHDSEVFLTDAQRMAENARRSASLSGMNEEEKAAADKRAATAETLVEQAKALLDSGTTSAESKRKAAEEAAAAAEQSIAEVAAKSFALGQITVEFDKVTHNSEERLKQANSAVEESGKKLSGTERQLKKAEMERSRSETELTLARGAEVEAGQAVQTAQTEVKTFEEKEQAAGALAEQARAEASQAQTAIYGVAFSSDQATLATVGEDGMLRTWSAEDGRAFEVYDAGQQPLRTVAYDATAKQWLAGGETRALLVPAAAWELERRLGNGQVDSPIIDRVNALDFDPDGRWLATGGGEPSRGGEIKIWQIADGTLLQDLPNIHSDAVLGLEFSRDGKYLASAATDKFARVLNVETWEVEHSFEGHTHHVMGVSWRADGRALATGGADKFVKVWDVRKEERKQNVQGFDKEITSIRFVGITGQVLVTAGDNKVRLMQEDGKELRTFGGVDDFQHGADVTPDGAWVVAGGEKSILRVWNGTTGDLVASFARPDQAAGF